MKLYLIIFCYLLSCLYCKAGGEKSARSLPPVASEKAAVSGSMSYGFKPSVRAKQASGFSSERAVPGLQARRQNAQGPEEGLINLELLALLGIIAILGMVHGRQAQ